MAALHDALKYLGPVDFSDLSIDDLRPFLSEAFNYAQLIVDSVPIPAPPDDSASPIGRSRSNTASSASSASEVLPSSARSSPPPQDVEALQKEWKGVKMNPRENPLGMSVYKLGGKDGKGAWFARRSVHEGLGFTKWKKALEREFPETMKVQGAPGEGNIRGIGGERRVAYSKINGVGKMEVYLLTAQFPGPTTPRDFVTMVLTSDQAIKDQSGEGREVPRHYMVISKPCIHPDAAPRDGFIRGQYESVEFIREIPIHKGQQKSASTSNLGTHGRNRSSSTLGREAILRNAQLNGHSPTIDENEDSSPHEKTSDSSVHLSSSTRRARGKTISFDTSRGSDAKGENMDNPRYDESESNPIEWIMITRSDPGGSVPRFMIERGTPNGIVSDASKFLNWACGTEIEDLQSDEEEVEDRHDGQPKKEAHGHHPHHRHESDLHNYDTNGHLAGLDESIKKSETTEGPENGNYNGGIYGMVAGAGAIVASHTPAIITDHLPHHGNEQSFSAISRQDTVSSVTTLSSVGTFASALEGNEEQYNDNTSNSTGESSSQRRLTSQQDKELQKLSDKKRKLDEKLSKAREKETAKKNDDTAKEEIALRKVEEKHEREVKRQQERYRKEVEKLELKKEREARKAEGRKKKAEEKDEKIRMARELEEVKAEMAMLRKEKELLRSQVGELQAENTALAARVGRLGVQGEEVLRDVREEVGKGGRLRATSLRGLGRPASMRSSTSVDREKEKENLRVPD
ncbi:hypothetical protein B7494_g7877 [Chlorociboria aeruginascens]|nr:hypothetical protein B7494_g7877 [Chlorociboria aeruginascens]